VGVCARARVFITLPQSAADPGCVSLSSGGGKRDVTCLKNKHASLLKNVYIYIYVCICMYRYISIYMICIYVCISICMYICMYVCIDI